MTAATRTREPRAKGGPEAVEVVDAMDAVDAVGSADAVEAVAAAEAAGTAEAPASRPVRSGVELRAVRRPVTPRPLPPRPAPPLGPAAATRVSPARMPRPTVLTAPAAFADPSGPPAGQPEELPRARPRSVAGATAVRPPRSVPPAVLPDLRVSRPSMVAYLVAAAVVTLLLVGLVGWVAQSPAAEPPAAIAVARVGAGETVWDVVSRVAPTSDPRVAVDRVRELNGLVGSAVEPGQWLRVPVEE